MIEWLQTYIWTILSIIVIIVGAIIAAKLIKDIIEEDRKNAQLWAEIEKVKRENQEIILEIRKYYSSKQKTEQNQENQKQ
jgi:vancomycin permeability regulator SanA